MKITEIVGSYADEIEQELLPDNGLLQTIANAFTPSGKVKSPLNQQLPFGQPIAGHIPFSSVPALDAEPAVDAVSKDSSYAPRLSTDSCSSSPQKNVAMAVAHNSVYHR
jgi:hypothetical protein